MTSKMPLVTIGMAVYNEERFIRESIESILSQRYPNFRLIISDNASTDNTGKICEEFQSKDKRVSYSRNKENLGSLANFNRVFALAEGKYFMWASGHDLRDAAFISRCVEIMEKDRKVVVCHSQTRMIDSSGKITGVVERGINIDGKNEFCRMHDIIYQLAVCAPTAIYGLIRLETLKKIRPVQNTFGSDHINLIELSYHGKIFQMKAPLYSQRNTHTEKKTRYEDAFKRYEPSKKKIFKLTYTKMYFNYLYTIQLQKLSFFEKMRLYLFTTKIFMTKRFRSILINDYLRFLIGEKNIYRLVQLKKKLMSGFKKR